ncbi:flagellar assembly protein FliW, partial [Treponema pallidum]
MEIQTKTLGTQTVEAHQIITLER